MKIRYIAVLLLAFSVSLSAPAQEKRSFWDHGLGKFLKSADEMFDRMQEEGVDTRLLRWE